MYGRSEKHNNIKSQESEARIQNSGVRMKREKARRFQDLIAWQKAHQSGETSKLLETYYKAILDSDSSLF